MDNAGLWELFWKTGLPEVYLAIRAQEEREEEEYEPALTAFQARPPRKAKS